MRVSCLAGNGVATVAPAAQNPHLYESQFVCTAMPKSKREKNKKTTVTKSEASEEAETSVWPSKCCLYCTACECRKIRRCFLQQWTEHQMFRWIVCSWFLLRCFKKWSFPSSLLSNKVPTELPLTKIVELQKRITLQLQSFL